MELQCKERVTLLEALRDSRIEAEKEVKENEGVTNKKSALDPGSSQLGWLGNGTIPAMNYPDLSKPGPPLPRRPVASPIPTETRSFRVETGSRVESNPSAPINFPIEHKPLTPNPPPVLKQTSRTPSPDKRDARNKLKTTLRPVKDKRTASSTKTATKRPPAASKAAGLAWDSKAKQVVQTSTLDSSAALTAATYDSRQDSNSERADSRRVSEDISRRDSGTKPPTPPPHTTSYSGRPSYTEPLTSLYRAARATNSSSNLAEEAKRSVPNSASAASSTPAMKSPIAYSKPEFPSYRSEYPAPTPVSQASITAAVNRPRTHEAPTISGSLSPRTNSPPIKPRDPPAPPPQRRPAANASALRRIRPERPSKISPQSSESAEETTSGQDPLQSTSKGKTPRKKKAQPLPLKPAAAEDDITPDTSDAEPEGDPLSSDWLQRLTYVKKHLPKGVDPSAAKQIFNEIVVQGDEVHWEDVAGLDGAKKALKEAVVYPFLRPDLFMGLREPARGMLLFGPPGTGKTMLARAVATESRSTFFAISASSLTSKWLGDSEKLVRALFSLAKALAPSIIFVDEIDSLLSSRGGSSEHESTRRIKTEFLIQWSDLQRAAAGKEQSEKEKREGDATRVLVLAATNLPWAIDEAARRRFVRRQYIPLPEREVRAEQLRTLLGHQKCDLSGSDIEVLVRLTDGKSMPGMTLATD